MSATSLLRSNEYYLYLKKYPSLEDLKEEENEDSGEFKTEESKIIENRVIVRKKEFPKQNVSQNTNSNHHVYEEVNQRDAYVKKISYSSTLTNKCFPLKGYVRIFNISIGRIIEKFTRGFIE